MQNTLYIKNPDKKHATAKPAIPRFPYLLKKSQISWPDAKPAPIIVPIIIKQILKMKKNL